MADRQQNAALREQGGAYGTEAAANRPHGQYTTEWRPVALQVWKRGRWATVAKIVPLEGEIVLGVAIRNQIGTDRAISLPLCVVAYAEELGCRWFYRRDDRSNTMGRISLAKMKRHGWQGRDGELYIFLTDLEPVAWRPWAYAMDTKRIGEAGRSVARRHREQPSALQQGALWR